MLCIFNLHFLDNLFLNRIYNIQYCKRMCMYIMYMEKIYILYRCLHKVLNDWCWFYVYFLSTSLNLPSKGQTVCLCLRGGVVKRIRKEKCWRITVQQKYVNNFCWRSWAEDSRQHTQVTLPAICHAFCLKHLWSSRGGWRMVVKKYLAEW